LRSKRGKRRLAFDLTLSLLELKQARLFLREKPGVRESPANYPNDYENDRPGKRACTFQANRSYRAANDGNRTAIRKAPAKITPAKGGLHQNRAPSRLLRWWSCTGTINKSVCNNQLRVCLIRIRLFHWNFTEAEAKTLILESLGYEVDYEQYPPKALKQLRNSPPAAVIIDLSRLPSQGRDIAVNILHAKATRNIPIIFVEGDPQKVQQIKMHVPDAIYTHYDQIDEALKKAFTDPPKVKLIPKSIFEPYKHSSLAKKLGIKPNSRLVLVNSPNDFTKTLGELPQNVTIENNLSNKSDIVILFAAKQESLRSQVIEIINELPSGGKLWIAWRKQGTETATRVTQATVRKTGLALGLVDYKICRIDSEWTALLFTRRRRKGSTSAPL